MGEVDVVGVEVIRVAAYSLPLDGTFLGCVTEGEIEVLFEVGGFGI